MFLSAVTQPEPKRKFDGSIGCAEEAVSLRKSKERKVGIKYIKDVLVIAEVFKKMLKETVIPAVSEKMLWTKEVVIQIDNAKAHIGVTSWPR